MFDNNDPLANALIYNAIKTPDGTILESRHRHDFKTHVDSITNKEYMVDGGSSYVRRSAHLDQECLNVYLSDGHTAVREALTWGTRGIDGLQPLTLIKLCDMATDHIEACLTTQYQMDPKFRYAMQVELAYRELFPTKHPLD